MNEIDILKDITISHNEAAEMLGCHPATVFRKRKKLGFKRPFGRPKNKTKHRTCVQCDIIISYQSTKIPKFCSKKCYQESKKGKQCIPLHVLKNIDRSYMKTKTYSEAKSKPDVPAYRKYAGAVHRATQSIYEEHKDHINPNNYPRTLAGVDGGYHLDHIVSVRWGFDNNVPVDGIARLENLRMLPWRQNVSKGKRNGSI